MVSDWRLYYAKANYLTINPLLFTSFLNLVFWKMNSKPWLFFNSLMISLEPSTALYSIVSFPYACSLLPFNYLIVLSSSSKNWYLSPSFSSLSLVFISLQSRVVHFPYFFGDIRSPVHPFPFFYVILALPF